MKRITEVHEKLHFLKKHNTVVDFNNVEGGVKIKVTINGRTTQFSKVVSLKSINEDSWKVNPKHVTMDFYVKKYKKIIDMLEELKKFYENKLEKRLLDLSTCPLDDVKEAILSQDIELYKEFIRNIQTKINSKK